MFRSIANPGQRRRLGVSVVGALVSALVGASVGVLWIAGPASAAAAGGVGATLPYAEVQAESSATNGSVVGPSSAYGTLAGESSFRKAVTLAGTGKYVEFTTPRATNSMVFRYSIPDSSNGAVYTPQLSLYINGTKSTNFTLTNAFSWYYGNFPWTNTPSDGKPHHFYDEANRLFPTTYPAGTTFRLQIDAEDTASSYTIDFADFEAVAGAVAQPSGSISVTSKGADATGSADATAAFNSAISSAGAGGTVWIPEGRFRIPGHIAVNNVTIRGAGMWRSQVIGAAPGFFGNAAPNPSTGVHLADFAIFGNVQERDDNAQVNAIGGAMSNSTVDRIWIEHQKVGVWVDGPFTNFVLSGLRIRNVTADGVNFHKGVTNSRVTNSDIRNTGDDGLAAWSDAVADVNVSFDHNTVQYPILANGIAIYGGNNNFVTDNRVIDSGLLAGGGIYVAQRFASTALGQTDLLRNTLIRDGSFDPNWNFGVGALWFDARDSAMSGVINVDDILIQQSMYEAIQFISSNISNVTINNATIQNTGTFVIQEQAPGSATIRNSTATGTQAPSPIYSCSTAFTLNDGGGNSGIFGGSQCSFPTPAFPPDVSDGPGPGPGPGTTNIALGKAATASSQVGSQPAGTSTDGNTGTYWESVNGTFPQWLQVDLGTATSIGRVVLKLPPTWTPRTQTLSVQTSTDGSSFTTAVPSATYTFDPASANTVTITVPTTTARYVRVNITANTGWAAGQLSELEVYPGSGLNGTHVLHPNNAPTMALDNNAGSTATGNRIQIWTTNGTPAQSWVFSDANVTPAGFYRIALAGNFCATASGSTSSSPVNLQPCSGSSAQAWRATGSGAGYTFSPASNTGLCLDVKGAGTTSGTLVQVYTCNGGNNQLWTF